MNRHPDPGGLPDCIEPDWPYGDRLRVLTTTRRGGVSRGPWAELNLALHVGDRPADVAANRARLKSLIGGRPVCWLDQVHGRRVVEVKPGRNHEADGSTIPEADGAWTAARDQVLAVLTADCLPVVLVDRAFEHLAVVHAGWRGLVTGVLEAAVGAMPVPPAVAWLGPAIGVEVYEVGEAVLAPVAAHPLAGESAVRSGQAPGKGYLDLKALATSILQASGIEEVYGEGLCTFSDRRFFSYRRDGITGRMATVAWLPS